MVEEQVVLDLNRGVDEDSELLIKILIGVGSHWAQVKGRVYLLLKDPLKEQIS